MLKIEQNGFELAELKYHLYQERAFWFFIWKTDVLFFFFPRVWVSHKLDLLDPFGGLEVMVIY